MRQNGERGFAYDRSDIHRDYDRARQLAPETLRAWMEAMDDCALALPTGIVVDLGCGTGRFSRALADHFSAWVLGIDPSANMLTQAKHGAPTPTIAYARGAAEHIPLASSKAGLVFLSMVYHHLEDKLGALRAIRRVLRPGGVLCVRTSTVEGMDAYPWLRFFPRAREIELCRAPSRPGLIEDGRTSGFALWAHRIVRQCFARDWNEYASKIGFRGLSSLKAIPDAEFEKGLADLTAYCRGQQPNTPVFEDIDLFVFVRKGDKSADHHHTREPES